MMLFNLTQTACKCRLFSGRTEQDFSRALCHSVGGSQRMFGSRAESEEKYHLARQLSRNRIDPKTQQKWASMAKKFKRKTWSIAPFEAYLVPSANYEMEALQAIHKKSFQANILLEIRDVRLPASSHHPSFTRLAKHRLHLICYTHADVIDASTRDRVEKWTLDSWPKSRSIFVDSRQERGDAESFDLVYDSLLHHIDSRGGTNTALTVGIANTGKSSLLLSLLRNAKSRGLIPKKVKTKVGGKSKSLRKGTSPEIMDVPGKTRTLTEYLLRQKPRAFFLDVPGITPPKFFFRERPTAWLGFCAVNSLPLTKLMKVDPGLHTAFCDYVLDCMNRDRVFQYVDKIGLEAPTNDIDEVLSKLSIKYDRYDDDKLRLKRCTTFLKLFNTGNLGPVILDDISKPYVQFKFEDKHFQRDHKSEDDYDELEDDYDEFEDAYDEFEDDYKR